MKNKNKNINVFLPKFRKEEILKHIEECLDKGWTGIGFKTVEFEAPAVSVVEPIKPPISLTSITPIEERVVEEVVVGEST